MTMDRSWESASNLAWLKSLRARGFGRRDVWSQGPRSCLNGSLASFRSMRTCSYVSVWRMFALYVLKPPISFERISHRIYIIFAWLNSWLGSRDCTFEVQFGSGLMLIGLCAWCCFVNIFFAWWIVFAQKVFQSGLLSMLPSMLKKVLRVAAV